MGKHKKHKKHHSHPHSHGSKDMSMAAPEMKVVVPLQSLLEPEPADPTQLSVSIPRTLLHPSHPHSTRPHTPQQTLLAAHSQSEHKSHKKHKKKHKKRSLEESAPPSEPQQQPPKIAPLRLPVPKSDPPHTPQPLDPAHTHTRHSKHKHKRSRDSMEGSDHYDSILEAPKFKRPKIGFLQLGEGNSPEAEKRLVTPLHLQLPPGGSHDGHKHKKKKKKHKHSKTSVDEIAWEISKSSEQSLVPSPQPSPIKTMPSEPKATPTKIDHPPIQSSPGKQMRLLRGLEQSIRGKEDTTTTTKKQAVVVPRERPVEVVQLTPPTPVAPAKIKVPQVKLSENALKFFLKNLHHLIQKRDPEGVFGEPVTDDIAPNYSTIISQPMDLTTMATKIETSQYPSVNEFKADFERMCGNALTYNGPDTAYYGLAKTLLSNGLQIIAKETSLRPDILHGRLVTAIDDRGQSSSPLPSLTTSFHLPSSTNLTFDHTSPFLCRLPLSLVKGTTDDNNVVDVISSLGEIKDQSHLTRVEVGVTCEGVEVGVAREGVDEEVLDEVCDAAEAVKENLDVSYPGSKFCFVNRNDAGRTMLNILDPESSTVDYSKPIDLTHLGNKVRMGNNAATVLKTELPMMKATPVSYLMYGPFGSFAPAYDSAFASLAKCDSDQLLTTYGNELGVSYAHSLQQFVKGAGSFVSEMADAVLNGLTNGRHSKFVEKVRSKEKKSSEDSNSLPIEKKVLATKIEEQPAHVVKVEAQSTPCSVPSDKPTSPLTDAKDAITQDNSPTHLSEDKTLEDDNDPKSPFSVEDMATEAASPQDSLLLPRSLQESRATSPLSSSGSVRSSRGESVEEGSSSSSVSGEDSRSSHVSTDEGPQDTVDARLQATSELLTELQEAQTTRLSLPPQQSSSGQLLLPGPSQDELDTAAQVRGQLASLTAQVQPGEVVSVDSLHEAMGIADKERTLTEELMNLDNNA